MNQRLPSRGFSPGSVPELVLVVLLWTSGCAVAADDLADRIVERLASYPVVRADFVQERMVASLTKPVTSSGRMVLSREQGLLWQIDQPVKAVLVFGANGEGQTSRSPDARQTLPLLPGPHKPFAFCDVTVARERVGRIKGVCARLRALGREPGPTQPKGRGASARRAPSLTPPDWTSGGQAGGETVVVALPVQSKS